MAAHAKKIRATSYKDGKADTTDRHKLAPE